MSTADQFHINNKYNFMKSTVLLLMHGVLFELQQDDDGDQLLGSFSQLKDVLNNITGKLTDCI